MEGKWKWKGKAGATLYGCPRRLQSDRGKLLRGTTDENQKLCNLGKLGNLGIWEIRRDTRWVLNLNGGRD
jgi:hypothetical protein